MNRFVQSLEPRVVLSATAAQIVADELKILADARAVRADVQKFGPSLLAEAKQIRASLKALPATAQNNTLGSRLRADVAAWYGNLKSDVLTLVRTGESAARKSVADGIAVYLSPSNTAARAKLAADLKSLDTATAAPITRILADVASARTAVFNDLNAISAANPSAPALQATVLKASTDSQAALGAATTDVQAIQTHVRALVTDLGA